MVDEELTGALGDVWPCTCVLSRVVRMVRLGSGERVNFQISLLLSCPGAHFVAMLFKFTLVSAGILSSDSQLF